MLPLFLYILNKFQHILFHLLFQVDLWFAVFAPLVAFSEAMRTFIKEVDRCPIKREDWKINNKHCNGSTAYHCLLDADEQLHEVCLPPEVILKGNYYNPHIP